MRFISSSFLLLFFPIVFSQSDFPIVDTSFGSVRGYEYRAENGFVGQIFKKIPYAAPPIGKRRWKKPAPPERWNYTLDGTFFGPACAQDPARWAGYVTGFSEDCLTLNVYTSRQCRESSCPIVVYIHGGFALFDGTMMFPDEILVSNFASQGVIMVTVAYRLGVFGVMALGDENVLPANLAVHDALEALRFIRNEIHNFGGNKEEISVMGHSTGATIVLLLAFSPGINQPGDPLLFSRAIAMSATANFQTEEDQVAKSHAVAQKLGCSGSAREILDCMLPLSTDEMVQSATKTRLTDNTLAGELLPIRSGKELRENQKPMKLLLGTTVNEFGTAKSFNETEEEGKKSCYSPLNEAICTIVGVTNIEECARKIFDDYPDHNILSQSTFVTNSLFAKAQAKAGGEVFLYQYDYPVHSLHADDVYYLMGFHQHPMDANEKWLSRVYPVYFTNFIKGLPLAPDWKPFHSDLLTYYSINKSFTDDISPRFKQGYQRAISEYYEGMLKLDDKITMMKNQLLKEPMQYKEADVSTDSFSLFHMIFYSVVLCFLLFIVYKSIRFCRERSEEEIPLLSDQIVAESSQSITSVV